MIIKLGFLAMLTMIGFFTGVIVLQKWILPIVGREHIKNEHIKNEHIKKIIIIAIAIWFPLAGVTIGILIGVLPFLFL